MLECFLVKLLLIAAAKIRKKLTMIVASLFSEK